MTEAVLRERPAGWGLCCDGAISAVGGGGKRVGEAELHPGHSRLLRRHGATCPSEAEKEMERVGLTQFDPMQLRSHSTTRTPVVASPRTLVKSRLPEQEVDAGSHMMHPRSGFYLEQWLDYVLVGLYRRYCTTKCQSVVVDSSG
ncbi:hypothetical protein GW17_00034215 [Ensete ventricosum]|nr:hypothetical protein GW17_00034215 [Ensete ventricosum]RZR96311.1 hypothetical protein BHM03_00025339 [Ensete ventricosum]